MTDVLYFIFMIFQILTQAGNMWRVAGQTACSSEENICVYLTLLCKVKGSCCWTLNTGTSSYLTIYLHVSYFFLQKIIVKHFSIYSILICTHKLYMYGYMLDVSNSMLGGKKMGHYKYNSKLNMPFMW